MTIDLAKLREPFYESDVEWRVSRAGRAKGEIYCRVLCYITNRAIQNRLDEVCGPENWKNTELDVLELRPGVAAMQVGISIRLPTESGTQFWMTKYDCSEPTNIEPAKGGFSQAMKRAGSQWGIGRYLYSLSEDFAETSEEKTPGWNWAKLPEKQGGDSYWWKPPKLPSWALPKEPEHAVSENALKLLKKQWRDKYALEGATTAALRQGFELWVHAICGKFPVSDVLAWDKDALNRCVARLAETDSPEGVAADVPFDA